MNTKVKEDIPKELQKLANNRALILLVELMGFLHDVGKLSPNLYKNHYRRFDEEDSKDTDLLKWIIFKEKIFEKKFRELLKNKIDRDLLEKVKTCEIKGFQRHHIGKDYPKAYWPQNWIEEIINLADSKDSAEDRGKAISEQGEYVASVFGNEKRFFNKDLKELNNRRKDFWKELQSSIGKLYGTLIQEKIPREKLLEKFIEIHKEIIRTTEKYFLNIPAFTMRAGNDVTLFDHSYMTGSIAKSLVAKAILNDDIQERFSQQIIRRNASEIFKDKNLPKEERKIASKTLEKIQALDHFDDECDLDIVNISFDTFSFLSQSQNLLDIEGRKEILRRIKEDVKNLIEIEYALGNCIYEDEENLCFLITPISKENFDFLEKEIYNIFNKKTQGLLLPIIEKKENQKFYGKALTELIRICKEKRYESRKDFFPLWIKKWENIKDVDVCVLCGKMPQANGKKKDYLCEFCWNKRKDKKEEGDRGTPWIDEIADENKKIALIVGKFHPIDRWLSGDLLKYQKIRTKEDLKVHRIAKRYFADVSDSEYEKIKENAITKFARLLLNIKKHGDKDGLLHKQLKEKDLKNYLSDEEITFISGESKVGEFYYRIELDKIDTPFEKLKNKILETIETKPSSPSRIYRIWRELKEFSEVKKVIEEIPKGIRLIFENEELKEKLNDKVGFFIIKQVSKNKELDLGEITAYWDGRKLFTVERIDKRNPREEFDEKDRILKTHKEIADNLDGKEIRILLLDEKSREEIGEFNVKARKDEEYERYRKIIVSPTGFMIIVPANRSFELSQKIGKQFYLNFSKALGKLSLNIGIVLAYRKIPVFALLDAGRRLINEFSSLKDLKTTFISVKKEYLKDYEILSLKIGNKEIFWKIGTKLGDGNKDNYYPYFISTNGKPMHFSEIKLNKGIKIYPNKFDFEYLDSSIRRFDIVVNKNGKRCHSIIGNSGPRPYLLEDLEKFQKLLDIFKIVGSWTPIKDLEALAETKRMEWIKNNDSKTLEVYKKLMESAIENKLLKFFEKEDFETNIKPFLLESIMEGSFFDAIELFHFIMKEKLGGEKVE